jgi:hypothetical protein
VLKETSPFEPISWAWWKMAVVLAMWEVTDRGTVVQAGLGKKNTRFYLKKKKKEKKVQRTGSMGQVVVCL